MFYMLCAVPTDQSGPWAAVQVVCAVFYVLCAVPADQCWRCLLCRWCVLCFMCCVLSRLTSAGAVRCAGGAVPSPDPEERRGSAGVQHDVRR